MKIIKSFILTILLLHVFNATYAQTGYVVRVTTTINSGKSGFCTGGTYSMKWVWLYNKTTGECLNGLMIADNYGDGEHVARTTLIVPKDHTLEVRFTDWKGGNYAIPFKISSLGSFEDSKKKTTQTLCYRHSTLTVKYEVKSLAGISSTALNPKTCVSNPNGSYRFNFQTHNIPLNSFRLQVSNDKDFPSNSTNEVYISPSATYANLSYNQLAGSRADSWYGQTLYFRTKSTNRYCRVSTYCWDQVAYSATFSESKAFYMQISAPTGSITALRRACSPNLVVTIPATSEMANNYNNYTFRMIKGNCENGSCLEEEQTSNIIRLVPVGREGNSIKLNIHSQDRNIGLVDSVDYTVQIAQKLANEKISFDADEVRCAVKQAFRMPLAKNLLTTSPTIVPKDTFDGTTYHTSKHNLNDAVIHLAFNDRSRVAKVEMDYECNFSNDCHHYCSTCRDIVNVTSQLQNVGNYTKSLSMNFAYHQMSFRTTDTDSCVSGISSQVTLKKPSDVTLNQPTAPIVPCHVNNTGTGSKSVSIQATFKGGIGYYTARLYSNSGSLLETKTVTASDKSGSNYFVQFSPRGVGRYRVRITDRYGVYKDQYVDVISNPEVVLSATPTDLTCFEGGNGSIQLNATNLGGGTPTYTLSGRTESLTNYQNLSAGNYTATVTNYLGCQDIVNNITVGQPNDIIIDATGSKIARYGDNTGTINLTISEGTGDFDYVLYKDSTEIANGSTLQNATIAGLYDGYYRVDVTDDNGCPQTYNNIRVRQPDEPLELSFSQQPQNVDCNGNATGEVYPTATGGWGHYQYGFNETINGTSNTIGGLTATGAIADTVFVVDSAGIIEKLPVTITQPPQLITSIDSIYNLKCYEDNSGAVKLNISGGTRGYRVSMNNANWISGDSLSNLPIMDNEPVYVLDANDCPSQVDVTITQPDKIYMAVDTIIDAFCGQDNGSVTAIIAGGTQPYSYNWIYLDSLKSVPVNSIIIDGIYSGQYKLLLTDSHGCNDSIMVSVSDADGPDIIAYKIDSISCFGGSDGKLVIQQVDGGMPEYTYYLNGIEGDTIFDGLENKTYHFRLLDKKGCKVDKYYTIPQPEDISIIGTVFNPVCHDSYDGFIVTRVNGGNGGYSYNWSNNEGTKNIQNLNSGTYSLTVSDSKACTKSESFEIISPPEPTAHLDQNTGVLCTGNSLELDGGNFVSYKWYKDSVLISEDRYLTVDQTGQYTLKISNEYGCIGVDTFDLEVSDTPLDATILLQDSALVDEVIRAIDVTWPVPDSIQWYFDYPVDLADNNNYSQRFSSGNTGTINVMLRAWYGGCYSDSSKSVTIYNEEGSIPQKSTLNEPLILGFKVYPNSNDGNFYAEIELSRKADISLHLYNAGLGSAIDIKRQKGLESYEVPFNLVSLKPGVYIIVLIAEHEQQKLKIVIK